MLRRPVNTLSLGIVCALSLGVLLWLVVSNGPSPGPSASANPSLAPMDFTIPHTQGTMLTQQQVRLYVESHSFWVGPTVSGKMFTVSTVQLMTARQAYQEKHADSLGVPLNDLVYYVVAVGPFRSLNVTGPHPIKLTSVPTAYEIWDAHSGNLLEAGL